MNYPLRPGFVYWPTSNRIHSGDIVLVRGATSKMRNISAKATVLRGNTRHAKFPHQVTVNVKFESDTVPDGLTKTPMIKNITFISRPEPLPSELVYFLPPALEAHQSYYKFHNIIFDNNKMIDEWKFLKQQNTASLSKD